jgi:hypothetical protein
MFFQKVLKGICFDDDALADRMLTDEGILCNWWRKVGPITLPQIAGQLTERNLLWHLNHYSDLDSGEAFGKHSPFISTTAGTVERDAALGINVVHAPLMTALWFATNGFTSVGYIYYAYLMTLGKQAIQLKDFSEEVRDLHIYSTFLPHHPEGEVVAKIAIVAAQLERYEKFDGPACRASFAASSVPTPTLSQHNPNYADPVRFTNLRGFVS